MKVLVISRVEYKHVNNVTACPESGTFAFHCHTGTMKVATSTPKMAATTRFCFQSVQGFKKITTILGIATFLTLFISEKVEKCEFRLSHK